ncbi:MAG: hypothetical protein ACRDAM_13230 [Casimicrobium sp.]
MTPEEKVKKALRELCDALPNIEGEHSVELSALDVTNYGDDRRRFLYSAKLVSVLRTSISSDS